MSDLEKTSERPAQGSTLAPISAELVDVLDGFFEVRPRSATLHGDAPVRAVQACPPFSQGSGFGWELRYSGIGLALQSDAEPAVRMVDEMTPGFDYAARVSSAVAQGLLPERWANQLLDNWWWRDEQNPAQLQIWTGLIAKPGSACHLRLTELFNSPHLQLNLVEQWISQAAQWTPLVLTFTLRDTNRSAIAGAIASLSPVPVSSSMTSAALHDYPWVGQRILDYYNPTYYEQKLHSPPTKAYTKLLRKPSEQASWQPQHSSTHALALAANPRAAEQIRYHSWGDGQGPCYAELVATADIRLMYLGRTFDPSMGPGWDEHYQADRLVWEQLFGAPGGQYLDDATYDGTSCVHPTSGHPVLVLNIEPLLRFVTKPGWSLIFEGASETFAWGLRGIISSAQFHSGALAFQCFDTPATTVIPQDSRLGRVIPIPNELINAGYSLRSLEA